MPLDFVIVRHGQSEGNRAKRRSEAGDHTAFTEEFRNRHTAAFRLSALGRRQAAAAGQWLKANFPHGFDRYITSEYHRAMETAALLGLPNANWYRNFFATERGWGNMEAAPENERQERFRDELLRREVEPFHWSPPNGENFTQLCVRLNLVLGTLHRECRDKQALLVCHGEVMWGIRILMERMTRERFKELHLSDNPDDRIHNCQIIHYTRKDPITGKVSPYANWVRMVRPTETPLWDTGWQRVERPTFTNTELLELVNKTPVLVDD